MPGRGLGSKKANARVASVSPVPVMLDEPICELADVKRASAIANVGFCKLKLKRFGGLYLLYHLVGLIRPTRRHIAISPHGGLYAMPSLCGSA